jgi:hypothetical protein
MQTYYHNIEQGSAEWHALRCGIVTASEMKKLFTATLKPANNDTVRRYAMQKVAEQLTGRVEEVFVSHDMLRGKVEEIRAVQMYSEHYAPVATCGFITDKDMGYSPDGLVADDGLIEVKSCKQSIQVERILAGVVPAEHRLQMQAGMYISGRKWCDFISFSNGMPLLVIREYADKELFALMASTVSAFYAQVDAMLADYKEKTINAPVAEYLELDGDIDVEG